MASLISTVTHADVNADASVKFDMYSQAVPLSQLMDNFQGDRVSEGEAAFSRFKAEIELEEKGVRFSIFAREDHLYEFSNSTVDLIQMIENEIAPQNNSEYNLYLKNSTFKSDGVGIGYDWALSEHFTLKGMANYFLASQGRFGDISGYAAKSTSDYSLELNGQYYDSEKVIDTYPVNTPDAEGYGVDLGFSYNPMDQLAIDFKASDLFSEINWSGINQIELNRSSTKLLNPDGTIVRNNGETNSTNQTYVDRIQTLPITYELEVKYHPIEEVLLAVNWMRYGTEELSELAYTRYFGPLSIGFSYEIESEAVGIKYSNGWFDLELMTDSFSLEDTNRLGLYSSLSYKF
ncbi:hypothetical protein XMG59_002240 [Marinobacterium sp. xm-g-59]|uniref:hypothetical protein n=1 Tax=Marinobacterium sp. xm-g-59 TaxID=2497748 RepID=UPI0015698639|nr:hypothetical protein [Marinobacterium sp. xm-g-59]NRP96122.1 hypothetical protein [Marinobacterium sp. xm-g-59]